MVYLQTNVLETSLHIRFIYFHSLCVVNLQMEFAWYGSLLVCRIFLSVSLFWWIKLVRVYFRFRKTSLSVYYYGSRLKMTNAGVLCFVLLATATFFVVY